MIRSRIEAGLVKLTADPKEESWFYVEWRGQQIGYVADSLNPHSPGQWEAYPEGKTPDHHTLEQGMKNAVRSLLLDWVKTHGG